MSENKEPVTMRSPFPPHQIGKLPKPKSKDAQKGYCDVCHGYHGLPAVHLDYIGHAAITDRLLDVDPSWSWEPLAIADSGLPVMDGMGGMWIKLTVNGVTRLGYGDAGDKVGGNAIKEVIGDAIRNAAMRFGAGLELWHKGDLHITSEDDQEGDTPSLIQEGRSAAMDGMPALTKWWGALTAEQRSDLNKDFPALRKAAQAADKGIPA